jgi:hypothetical protein
MNEESLIKLYMDLTGATEASARSVFMIVSARPQAEEPATTSSAAFQDQPQVSPSVRPSARASSPKRPAFLILPSLEQVSPIPLAAGCETKFFWHRVSGATKLAGWLQPLSLPTSVRGDFEIC